MHVIRLKTTELSKGNEHLKMIHTVKASGIQSCGAKCPTAVQHCKRTDEMIQTSTKEVVFFDKKMLKSFKENFLKKEERLEQYF